ncbi:MAG: response regulator [Bacteroidia bacterium]
MKIRIGLVEDHLHLQKSICENLSGFDEVELVFVASNGQEAIEMAKDQQPDLILMDIHMPVMDGITATRRIRLSDPKIKIVMLTVFDDGDHIFQAILAGANGYLLKDARPSKLLSAIQEALEGGAPMSPQIAAKTLLLVRGQRTEALPEKNDFDLTKRELEILDKLSSGDTYQQIADKLFISPKTVRKHIEHIYEKLQAHNKVEAIDIARRSGLLPNLVTFFMLLFLN